MTQFQNGNGSAVGKERGAEDDDAEGSDIEDVVEEPVQHKDKLQSKRQRKK